VIVKTKKIRTLHVPAREYTLRIRMSPAEVDRLNALIDLERVPASTLIRSLIDREHVALCAPRWGIWFVGDCLTDATWRVYDGTTAPVLFESESAAVTEVERLAKLHPWRYEARRYR
jgi:hypothetical protein